MRTRNWPIHSKIVALVIVPLAALLALWIFATTLTVGPALSLLSAQTTLDEVGRPGERLVAELQRERRLSLIFLAGGDRAAELRDQRTRTDKAIAEFRRRASDDELRGDASDLIKSRLDQTLTALDILPSGRGFIDRHEMETAGALDLYNKVIASAFRTFDAMAALPDEDINRRVRALTSFGQARELLGQADALLAGVFAAGQFKGAEHSQFVQIIGAQRFLREAAAADLRQPDRVAYQRMIEGEAFVRLDTMLDEMISAARPGVAPPVNAEAWHSSHAAVQDQLREFELAVSDRLAEDAIPLAVGILLRLGMAGVVGLAAIIVAVVTAVRIGRALVHRLTGLRAAALEMAESRLPDVISRLRHGEEVDVAAEAPPLRYGKDEIGQVAHAFSEVQRTAVQSAVDEAALRRGLNEVFLNIARRSQTLLHRQLSVLDRMERHATDPEELENLFRIDHLATRMRRHAEDLVVLAGATPGRGWRNPVAMIDVIRGAVSEVEDYARVDIMAVQPAATVGRAVGDVIHLLAELIENATAFSPPHTRVQVAGQAVPNGYVIEIEDRGLGMTPEAIEDANQRLLSPPDFDPANSARLGLFVVARLGARHGVRVRLRPSPYGGITAVALLPTDLVVLAGSGNRALPGQGRRGALDREPVPELPVRRGTDQTQNIHPVLVPSELPEHPPPESQRRMHTANRLANLPRQRPRPEDVPPAQVGESATPPRRGDRPNRSQRGPGQRPGGVSADGLPRRVRQSSMAPQLRNPAAAAPPTPEREPIRRSPEDMRAAMSALQAGTARGRREAAPLGNDVPPAPAGDPGGPTSPTASRGDAGGGSAADKPVAGLREARLGEAGPAEVEPTTARSGGDVPGPVTPDLPEPVAPDVTAEGPTDSGRNG